MNKFFRKAFGYESISYYSVVYHYEMKPQIGWVIVLNERIFFIPTHKRLSVALTKEDLDSQLAFYKNYYNL
jgi:hypothetical protein